MKSFLIIQTASIGDVILATPVIEKLHACFPEAKIDFLLKKGNEKLFLNHPFLNQVITWNKTKRKYRNLFWIIKDVKDNRYDVVINIQRFLSTGILTVFSGAKHRIGFSKNPLSFLYTRRIKHKISPGIHETERNLSLIEKLTGSGIVKPKLYPSGVDYERARVYQGTGYYTISPGSIWFTKQFPVQNWIDFASRIDTNYPVLYLGSQEDQERCDYIIHSSKHGNSLNLAGSFSFLESAALMKGARMNFTCDSAPMHLASAVNAPVTVVFCSTVPGFGFGPLSDISHVVETLEKLKCRPCGLHGFKSCPEKHFKCASGIDTRQLTDLL